MRINRETFQKITSIRKMSDHLERSDAMFLRFEIVENLRSEKLRRRKIFKSVVGTFAVFCAVYAVLVQF